MSIRYTHHAGLRMCQRNLDRDDIDFIVQYGRLEYRTGLQFYRLLRKNLPPNLAGNSRFRRLVGTTVLVCRCGSVITAYRNSRAHKRDRRKAEYNAQPMQIAGCEFCEQAQAH